MLAATEAVLISVIVFVLVCVIAAQSFGQGQTPHLRQRVRRWPLGL